MLQAQMVRPGTITRSGDVQPYSAQDPGGQAAAMVPLFLDPLRDNGAGGAILLGQDAGANAVDAGAVQFINAVRPGLFLAIGFGSLLVGGVVGFFLGRMTK
jgi:hypothetical protein